MFNFYLQLLNKTNIWEYIFIFTFEKTLRLMKNFILIILSSVSMVINAQLTDNNRANNDGSNRPNQLMTIRKDYSDVKVEGSPYYHTTYQKGAIINNGVETLVDGIRYNGFTDNLEINEGGRQYDLLRRDYLYGIVGSDTLRIYPYNTGNENKSGYLIPKTIGNVSFFFKPAVRLRSGKEPTSGFEKYIPPKYVEDHKYFTSVNDGIISEIKLNNRTLKDLFSDKLKEVNRFIKDQGLSVKEVDDFAKIVEFYNGL